MTNDDRQQIEESSPAKSMTRRHAWWVSLGLALIGCHAALLALSRRFAYGSPMEERPIFAFVLLMAAAGAAYIAAVLVAPRAASRRTIAGVFVAGLVMRGLMLPSTPILEDDFFRYLWDGGVLAHGLNPYTHAPDAAADSDLPKLRALAAESEPVNARVNHPDIRTIYPPVAQAAFAIAHWLGPWQLWAWRAVLLAFDIATFVLLLALLRELRLPAALAAVYWWNPLVVKEGFNSAHMDLVLLPFLLAALLLAVRGRPVWSTLLLALATAAKVWPLILLPVVWRPLLKQPRRLFAAAATFAVVTAVLYAPVLAAGIGSDSGFAAYGKRWEMNDALFMLILWPCQGIGKLAPSIAGLAPLAARAIAFVLLLAWIAWLVRRDAAAPRDVARRFMWAVAALFLLSPTQFPWYYVWLVPFLAFELRVSLLLLTPLLPIYYLRFDMNASLFDNGVVWAEYVPVWCLLGWEWWAGRKAGGAT